MRDEVYEPTARDLADLEMEEYDSFEDSDAWIESMLVGLGNGDF